MEIKIQVLSVSTETKPTQKGSYQMLEVAYKDLSNGGKVSAKKLMSFTNKEVFSVLAVAKAADVFDVVMEKGEKYWDWVKVTKGQASLSDAATSVAKTTGPQSVSGGNRGFETPEERAKKQIYIVRQSSLSSAIDLLTANVKTQPTVEEVIKIAQLFESFVFGTRVVEDVVSQDVGTIESIEEDIPF